MSLFRSEALEHRQYRLHGEVIVAHRLSTELLVWLIVLIMAGISTWLVLGSYARTEIVRGTLITDQPSAQIIAPTPGLVERLFVRDGSTVRAGAPIGLIKADRQDETGSAVGSSGLATLDRRLVVADQQMALAKAFEQKERTRLRNNVQSTTAKLAEVAAQIVIQEEIVASNKQLFEQLSGIVQKGFVSRVQYEARRQTWLSSQQQLGALRQQKVALKQEQAGTMATLNELGGETMRQVNEVKSSVGALEQQRAELRGASGYRLIAPISGTVTGVQTGVGSSARTDEPLMTIVPVGSSVRAEIYAPSRAIGFIRLGQEVRLLYDAFPYQRFGTFRGRVTSISRTALDPRDLRVGIKFEEPVYRITVAIERQSVEAYGQRIRLQPGMTLAGSIVLERQSFLQWLLLPLRSVTKRT